MYLSELLKYHREKKELLMRELAYKVDVDTAVISKIEKGDRKPTKEQLHKYAIALDIDYTQLHLLWLSEKVYQEIKEEETALEVLKVVAKRIKEEKNNNE